MTNIKDLEDTLRAFEQEYEDHKRRAARNLPLKFNGLDLEIEIKMLRQQIRGEYDHAYNTLPK